MSVATAAKGHVERWATGANLAYTLLMLSILLFSGVAFAVTEFQGLKATQKEQANAVETLRGLSGDMRALKSEMDSLKREIQTEREERRLLREAR